VVDDITPPPGTVASRPRRQLVEPVDTGNIPPAAPLPAPAPPPPVVPVPAPAVPAVSPVAPLRNGVPSPVVPIAVAAEPVPAPDPSEYYSSPVIPLAGLSAATPSPAPATSSIRPAWGAAPSSGGSFLGRPPSEMTAYQPAVVRTVPPAIAPEPAPVVAGAVEPGKPDDAEPKAPEKPDKKGAPGRAETKDKKDPADSEATGGRRKLSEPVLWVMEVAIWVVAALIVSTLLRIFVVQLFVVPSSSMEDTLEKNDRIASLKYAHYQRGDIVVFVDPGEWLTEQPPPIGPVHHFLEKIGILASTDQQYLVKRVIGLPGDTVQCCTTTGALSVNGTPIDETAYLKQPDMPASAFQFTVTVPAGRVFVMGDNRNNSADSRFHLCAPDPAGFGMSAFVPEDKIIGPVRAVVLPFSRIGHKATPTSLFANVPPATGSPPNVGAVSVTGGPYGSCHS